MAFLRDETRDANIGFQRKWKRVWRRQVTPVWLWVPQDPLKAFNLLLPIPTLFGQVSQNHHQAVHKLLLPGEHRAPPAMLLQQQPPQSPSTGMFPNFKKPWNRRCKEAEPCHQIKETERISSWLWCTWTEDWLLPPFLLLPLLPRIPPSSTCHNWIKLKSAGTNQSYPALQQSAPSLSRSFLILLWSNFFYLHHMYTNNFYPIVGTKKLQRLTPNIGIKMLSSSLQATITIKKISSLL